VVCGEAAEGSGVLGGVSGWWRELSGLVLVECTIIGWMRCEMRFYSYNQFDAILSRWSKMLQDMLVGPKILRGHVRVEVRTVLSVDTVLLLQALCPNEPTRSRCGVKSRSLSSPPPI